MTVRPLGSLGAAAGAACVARRPHGWPYLMPSTVYDRTDLAALSRIGSVCQ
jgi:hypothetical protein